MAWAKEGSDTLESANSALEVTSNDLKFNVILSHHFADSGSMQQLLRFNDSSATDYAYRRSENGGGDTTGTNATFIGGFHPQSPDGFVVCYVSNISGKEKLALCWGVGNATTGAGTAPSRREVVGKYDITTSLTQFDLDVSVASNFDTDSDLSALGTD